ncbi:hypothetical protein BCR33DRAFT_787114 [Rhizoclosmatium globosum]|uniref:Kinesin motor domain-containing protein n=1 Tax=Rhizoclosmatium globosum TaxID=329046 RepID=A0A1Y2C2X9_9FUNG|nr:hypothetical protein BCR33DRAFT_787114 [Rhizoclosmatium globosum]|eukprot:ORY41390.1 hypothetical protein BCR33DRAFT_787114 [Rhizoclosmatium globosum]
MHTLSVHLLPLPNPNPNPNPNGSVFETTSTSLSLRIRASSKFAVDRIAEFGQVYGTSIWPNVKRFLDGESVGVVRVRVRAGLAQNDQQDDAEDVVALAIKDLFDSVNTFSNSYNGIKKPRFTVALSLLEVLGETVVDLLNAGAGDDESKEFVVVASAEEAIRIFSSALLSRKSNSHIIHSIRLQQHHYNPDTFIQSTLTFYDLAPIHRIHASSKLANTTNTSTEDDTNGVIVDSGWLALENIVFYEGEEHGEGRPDVTQSQLTRLMKDHLFPPDENTSTVLIPTISQSEKDVHESIQLLQFCSRFCQLPLMTQKVRDPKDRQILELKEIVDRLKSENDGLKRGGLRNHTEQENEELREELERRENQVLQGLEEINALRNEIAYMKSETALKLYEYHHPDTSDTDSSTGTSSTHTDLTATTTKPSPRRTSTPSGKSTALPVPSSKRPGTPTTTTTTRRNSTTPPVSEIQTRKIRKLAYSLREMTLLAQEYHTRLESIQASHTASSVDADLEVVLAREGVLKHKVEVLGRKLEGVEKAYSGAEEYISGLEAEVRALSERVGRAEAGGGTERGVGGGDGELERRLKEAEEKLAFVYGENGGDGDGDVVEEEEGKGSPGFMSGIMKQFGWEDTESVTSLREKLGKAGEVNGKLREDVKLLKARVKVLSQKTARRTPSVHFGRASSEAGVQTEVQDSRGPAVQLQKMLNEAYADKDRAVESFEKEVSALRVQLSHAQLNVDALTNEKVSTVSALESDKKRLQGDLAALKLKLEDAENKVFILQAQVEKSRSGRTSPVLDTEARMLVKEHERIMKEAKERIRVLEKEVEEVRCDAPKAPGRREEAVQAGSADNVDEAVQSEVDGVQFERVMGLLKTSGRELASSKERVGVLEAKTQELEAQLDDARAKLMTQEDKRAHCSGRRISLQRWFLLITDLKARLVGLQELKTRLVDTASRYHTQEELDAVVSKSRDLVSESEKALVVMEASLAHCQIEIERMQFELSQARTEICALQERLSGSELKNSETLKLYKESLDLAHELEERLKEVYKHFEVLIGKVAADGDTIVTELKQRVEVLEKEKKDVEEALYLERKTVERLETELKENKARVEGLLQDLHVSTRDLAECKTQLHETKGH